MNLSDIVDAVATATGSSKADAKCATDAVFAAISTGLKAGDEVAVSGFGKFRVKTSAARTGRNPQTGEPIEIAESKSVGFKVSSLLKGTL